MNDNQKERLLKIAETHPELAKEMLDFMKEEKRSSQEPIAVKMVKSEDDKIEITPEQKKYATYLLHTYIIGFIAIAVFFVTSIFERGVGRGPGPAFICTFISVALLIGTSWYFSLKAGLPTAKALMAKHFKL